MISIVVTFSLLLAVASALPSNRITNDVESEDVEEYGDLYEGDMLLNDDQLDAMYFPTRSGLTEKKYRWPNNIVPYELSPAHTINQQEFIESALRQIESISCIKFVRRTNENDYIEITADLGCHADVGRQGGKQKVNLQPFTLGVGCFRAGRIMHEFLHALGFYHTHTRYDRDKYVTILHENIKPGKHYNFLVHDQTEVTSFNSTYDYDSVMHYTAYAFSKNGLPTIVPNDNSKFQSLGQRKKLSDIDISKLKAMYNCPI